MDRRQMNIAGRILDPLGPLAQLWQNALTASKEKLGLDPAEVSKGEFRFGPIRAYDYLLAVSQSKCPDLLYFQLRYYFYTRIPLYK